MLLVFVVLCWRVVKSKLVFFCNFLCFFLGVLVRDFCLALSGDLIKKKRIRHG